MKDGALGPEVRRDIMENRRAEGKTIDQGLEKEIGIDHKTLGKG